MLPKISLSPLQAKAAIRELLPGGLRESISKVRSSVAYAVSAIAHWDWPEAWPQLFTILMDMLVSGDVNAVHGAMRVLTGTRTSQIDPFSCAPFPLLTVCMHGSQCIHIILLAFSHRVYP
jgi:hypothetical protein